jgi:hypothetical protein
VIRVPYGGRLLSGADVRTVIQLAPLLAGSVNDPVNVAPACVARRHCGQTKRNTRDKRNLVLTGRRGPRKLGAINPRAVSSIQPSATALCHDSFDRG